MKEKVKETKTVMAWAVVSRKTGKIKHMMDYTRSALIYEREETAKETVRKSERVVPVTITYEVTR